MRRIGKWLLLAVATLILTVLVGGRIYQGVSESRDLARHPPPGELVRVDGRLMHIHCLGEGSPTVMFELGVGSVAVSWADIQREVAAFTRACVYDRAGLGYSEPTDRPLRASDVAGRLHTLLADASIDDDLVLVGWSAGGVYIREYQRRHPGRVKAMLLVASSHEQQAVRIPRETDAGPDRALRIARHLAPFGLVRLSGVMSQRVASSSASDDVKQVLEVLYHRSHMLETVWNESAAFELDIHAADPPSPIGDIPLTVVTPGRYEGTPAETEAWSELQRELVGLSPRGKQVIAAESGHNVYSDQPELVVEATRELVELVRDRTRDRGPAPEGG